MMNMIKNKTYIFILFLMCVMFISLSCGTQSDGVIIQNEFGIDVYRSTNGKLVSNDWVVVDGYNYYVNSIGEIAKNIWIDNTYYVGANGRMYHNYWLNVDNDWYYFADDGKALKDILIPIGESEYCFAGHPGGASSERLRFAACSRTRQRRRDGRSLLNQGRSGSRG